MLGSFEEVFLGVFVVPADYENGVVDALFLFVEVLVNVPSTVVVVGVGEIAVVVVDCTGEGVAAAEVILCTLFDILVGVVVVAREEVNVGKHIFRVLFDI